MSYKPAVLDAVEPKRISRRLDNANQNSADDESEIRVDFDWEGRHIKVQSMKRDEPIDINNAFGYLTPNQQLKTTKEIIALFLHNPHESAPVEFSVYDVRNIPNLIPGENIEINVSGLFWDPEGRLATIEIFWKGKRSNYDQHSRTSGRPHSSGGLVEVAGKRARLEDYLNAFREVGSFLMRPSDVSNCKNFWLREPRH